ncbi:MAG: hypothetical protein ABIK89_12950 [Planctomycetota bacterium]
MRLICGGFVFVALGVLVLGGAEVSAQQVTVSTPYHSVNDSFFEHMGTSWGLSGPNWSFSFGGGPLQAAPQFGGFDPSAGANLGFGWRSGGAGGFFNGNWSQGNRRSFVSQTPMVTLRNGVPGYFSDTSQTPFVMSYVPVVGGFPALMAPVQPMPRYMAPGPSYSGTGRNAVLSALERHRAERDERERLDDASAAEAAAARMNVPARPNVQNPGGPEDLILTGSSPAPADVAAGEPSQELAAARASSAGRPTLSVAEARRLHAAEQAEQEGEALEYVRRGRIAEAKGKPNVAKVYYQRAAARASGKLREQILARLDALQTPSQASR